MNKREQQKLERREKIILAAKELILKHGIQQVQLQEVADAVEIGIATLYRYFPNKEQLILGVNNEITAQMIKSLQQVTEQYDTAYAQIEHILDYYIDLADDPEYQFVRFFKAFESYKPVEKESGENEEYIHVRRAMADVLLEIAKKGKRDGSV